MSSRLELLTGGARDLPARQQTLRSTIDWSYDLLDAGEQTLFRRLGVFVGGCTLEAAEAVCNAEHGDLPMDVAGWRWRRWSTRACCGRKQEPDGEPRFVMLETIREYALERLEASGEAERLRRQHARYYLTLGEVDLSRSSPVAAQRGRRTWIPTTITCGRRWPGVRRQRAIQSSRYGSPARCACSGSAAAFDARRSRRWSAPSITRAASGARSPTPAARFELGQFLACTGDYAAARIQYEQALQLAREVGDPWWYAVAVEHLGNLAREQGDSATAWARLSESLALLRKLGYAGSIAEALNMLAEVAILDEDPARAEALLAESRAIEQRENADPNVIGWTLNHLGHAAQLRGAYDRAAQLHQESLECFQAFGDQHYAVTLGLSRPGRDRAGLGSPGRGRALSGAGAGAKSDAERPGQYRPGAWPGWAAWRRWTRSPSARRGCGAPPNGCGSRLAAGPRPPPARPTSGRWRWRAPSSARKPSRRRGRRGGR